MDRKFVIRRNEPITNYAKAHPINIMIRKDLNLALTVDEARQIAMDLLAEIGEDPRYARADDEDLVHDCLQNLPEYSLSLDCEGWNYESGVFYFSDPEDGRKFKIQYSADMPKLIAALRSIRKDVAEKGMYRMSFASLDDTFDAGNWDAPAVDCLIQIALLGEVVYS